MIPVDWFFTIKVFEKKTFAIIKISINYYHPKVRAVEFSLLYFTGREEEQEQEVKIW